MQMITQVVDINLSFYIITVYWDDYNEDILNRALYKQLEGPSCIG